MHENPDSVNYLNTFTLLCLRVVIDRTPKYRYDRMETEWRVPVSTPTPNAQRLLRTLIADGPTYRADLARSLDVSRATVTNLTTRLQSSGWIEETDPEPGSLKNLIGTTPKLGVFASILFLLDSCAVTVATLDGRVFGELTEACPIDAAAEERLTVAGNLLDDLVAHLPGAARSLRAVHLAVDTQMDSLSGDIYAQRASSRWFGVNPKRYFAERFGVAVHVQNSARLEGLAEYLWGAGRDRGNMLYVDVSYGITSGHVMDGVIQSGARGGSGELGHTVYDWDGPLCSCGNPGCLMQYASVPALLRDFRILNEGSEDWEQFRARCAEGDPASTSIASNAATVLGRMLTNVCHTIDPEVVVISGKVAREIPGFVDQVSSVLHATALPLVGRNVHVVGGELADMLAVTARAGIHSLRAIDDLITSASSLHS